MDSRESIALAIELIVKNILQSVDSPKALARCARINRMWYHETVPILWKGAIDSVDHIWRTPGVEFLTRLAQTPDRLRFYLSFVQFLDLYRDMCGPEVDCQPSALFKTLLWGTAKPISIVVDIGSDMMQEDFMVALLQPQLKSLELFGGYYSDTFLTELKRRAPKLVNLLLDNTSEDMTSRGFLDFLLDMPQIRQLELRFGFDFVITEPVMIHLMGRPNLEQLGLGDGAMLTGDVITKASEATGSLRCLDVQHIEAAVGRNLLPRMKLLEGFSLSLEQCNLNLSSDILKPLSRCSRIKDIYIHMKADTEMTAEDLIVLSEGCPDLRSLELYIDDSPERTVQHIAREGLAGVARRSSKLEELAIEYPCIVEISDFFLLGRNCPLLHSINLNATIDLLEIEDHLGGDVFPALQDLELKSFTTIMPGAFESLEDITTEEQLDEIFQNNFPLLERLMESSENKRLVEICKRLNKRLQQRRISSDKVRHSVRRTLRLELLQPTFRK